MQTSAPKPLSPRSAALEFWMSVLLVAFLFTLALRGLLAPDAAARGFGIAIEHPADLFYILVKGDRDLSSALALATLLIMRERRALGALVLVMTVQPVADFLLSVSDDRGRIVYALLIHMSAALYGWFLSYRLLRRR